LARFQADFEKRGVQLLILAHGDAEANRKIGRGTWPQMPRAALQSIERNAGCQGISPAPLASLGTPSAYLLDSEGLIASLSRLDQMTYPFSLRRRQRRI